MLPKATMATNTKKNKRRKNGRPRPPPLPLFHNETTPSRSLRRFFSSRCERRDHRRARVVVPNDDDARAWRVLRERHAKAGRVVALWPRRPSSPLPSRRRPLEIQGRNRRNRRNRRRCRDVFVLVGRSHRDDQRRRQCNDDGVDGARPAPLGIVSATGGLLRETAP